MKRDSRLRKLILTALFTSLSVVLGFLLAAVPNVELMTLTVFLAGVFLGSRLGALAGALSILFYSLFNPYGPPLLPLAAAQVAGFAIIGAVGGILSGRIDAGGAGGLATGAAAGCILTLVYDCLTTAAGGFIALGTKRFVEGIGGIFIAGAPFIALHVGTNTAIFALAAVPIVRVVRRWEGGGR
jgi:uncharacterized membrane protein